MAKSTNQKLKLLYLMRILLEKTDEEHGLRLGEIIDELAKYDVDAERTSLYSDFEALRVFGIDVNSIQKNRTVYYYVGSRDLEVAELKLLVDVIQSSKFITEKKSRQLIKKLERYVSQYDAQKLNRQVYVHGRIKTMNESIYYNVDKIHNAIDENVMIKFQYYQWNVDKEMELKHGGAFYKVSPWGLVWDDENYYMIAYDSSAEMIKHFRVDKMIRISQLDIVREGKDDFKKIEMSSYTRKRFGMFTGKEQSVTMLCENELAGVMLDRFGRDVKIRKVSETQFQITVDVAVSHNFFGWLIGLGNGVKIIAPDNVVEDMKQYIMQLYEIYGLDD